MKQNVVWAPQEGPQEALMHCPYKLIGFGGARGGGKTDAILGKFGYKASSSGEAFNAVFFRREMPQADDLINRAREIYDKVGALWFEQKKMFVFPEGGRIRFRPLENLSDAEKYQGQNISDIAVEEAGNYPDSKPIDRLFGCLRSAKGVKTQMILTFNPGGPGHSWLKERFINPAPLGWKPIEKTLPNGSKFTYIYIPSKVSDNPLLLLNDPNYIDNLHMVGSPQLVKAWLEGDWNIIEGAYFPEFGGKHIVAPHPIPKHWSKYIGFDWGYNSPFCAVWGAISSGKDDSGKEVPYPKGAIVIYREFTNKGLDNAEIGKRIKELSEEEGYDVAVADPSIFSHEGGASIAEQIRNAGMPFRPADNDRLSGWSQIRLRLKSNPPMLYFFSTCRYLLETIPSLPISQKRPEDVDTEANDHGADALRYLCKERLLETEYKPQQNSVKMGRVNMTKYLQERRQIAKRARL